MHLLAVVLESSVYSFGAVLLVVLTSLAAAAFAAGPGARRLGANRLLGLALWAQALLLLVLPAGVFATSFDFRFTADATLENGLLAAVLYGATPLFVGGLVFPLTFHLAAGERPGERLGWLLAANTLGGIVGSLAASFLLLDALGLWRSLGLLAAGYAVAALALRAPPRTRALRAATLLAAALALHASGHSPLELPVARAEPRRARAGRARGRQRRGQRDRGEQRQSLAAHRQPLRPGELREQPAPAALGTPGAAPASGSEARALHRLRHRRHRGGGGAAPGRSDRALRHRARGPPAGQRLLRRLEPPRAHGSAHAAARRGRPQPRARDTGALRRDRRGPLRALASGRRQPLRARALRGGARPPRPAGRVRAVAAALSARAARVRDDRRHLPGRVPARHALARRLLGADADGGADRDARDSARAPRSWRRAWRLCARAAWTTAGSAIRAASGCST